MLSSWSGNIFRHGALLIDKSSGMTSFDVIRHLQRTLRERTNLPKRALPALGHTGTLDPFATGLLMVCVGRAVKLVSYLTGCDKSYTGTIRFGEATATLDCTSPAIQTGPVPGTVESIEAAAARFVGTDYQQVPPMYSAKQVGGERLYTLARAGKVVARAPNACRIERLMVTAYDPPHAECAVTCSAGTYVRTLAEDLAGKLGTVAHLTRLRRESIGAWLRSVAVAVETAGDWLAGEQPTAPWWVPFDALLTEYPAVAATDEQVRCLERGQQHVIPEIVSNMPAIASYAAVYHAGRLCAVMVRDEAGWRLGRVFPALLKTS